MAPSYEPICTCGLQLSDGTLAHCLAKEHHPVYSRYNKIGWKNIPDGEGHYFMAWPSGDVFIAYVKKSNTGLKSELYFYHFGSDYANKVKDRPDCKWLEVEMPTSPFKKG